MKTTRALAAILLLVISTAAVAEENDKTSTTDPINTITIEELRDHMFFLASDEMNGRGIGTDGFARAAHYAASQFRGAGLKPLIRDAEGNPTYLQSFEYTPRRKEAEPVTSWNVIAMVEGSDPALKHEFVTVGAHLDHVSPPTDAIFNGADDNASGSTGVLEIAEAMAMSKPRRSVLFLLYGGEEVGLVGSRYFLEHSSIPLENIVVNINLDMIGRTDSRSADTRAHYVVGARRMCEELAELIAAVNERTVNWPLDFEGGEMVFTQSDHYSYFKKGIPAFFFFSGMHQHLHRPSDDPDTIEFDKMQAIAQLAYAVALEIADSDTRPCATEQSVK